MGSNSPNFTALAELGPDGATAFMALLRVILAVAEATPGGVGKAKHILLDHLAEMPNEEREELYARLVGVAISMADADVAGG